MRPTRTLVIGFAIAMALGVLGFAILETDLLDQKDPTGAPSLSDTMKDARSPRSETAPSLPSSDQPDGSRVITGFLLDGAGQLLDHTSFWYREELSGTESRLGAWQIDRAGDAGCFEITVDEKLLQEALDAGEKIDGRQLRLSVRYPRAGILSGDALVDLPSPDPSSDQRKIDLGILKMEALPLLVAGSTTGLSPSVSKYTLFTVGAVDSKGTLREFPRHIPATGITATLFEDHRFEVRGRVPEKYAGLPLALRLKDGRRYSDRIAFQPGQRKLAVPVLEPGKARGRVLLPEGIDHKAIKVSCDSVSPNSDVVTTWRLASADGRFYFDALRPGTGRFRINLRDIDTDLIAKTAAIISKETTVLPEIDLRTVLHRYAIALTFPNDDVPNWQTISVVKDIEKERYGAHSGMHPDFHRLFGAASGRWRDHFWVHIDTTPELTFLAQAQRCRHVYFTMRPGETVIEMKPKIPVSLEVGSGPDGFLIDLPAIKAAENLQLVLVLRDQGLDRSFDREFDLSLKPAVIVHRTELEGPGSMALRLELRQLTPNTPSPSYLTLHALDLGRIEVRDTEDQKFQVAVSAAKQDALRQVLADHLD